MMQDVDAIRRQAHGAQIFQAKMKDEVVDRLSSLRYEHGMPGDATINRVKEFVGSWLDDSIESLVEALAPHTAPGSGVDVAALIKSRLSWFKDVESSYNEGAWCKELMGSAFVAPVRRFLGGAHDDHRNYALDLPLNLQLQALFLNDNEFLHTVITRSQEWSEPNREAPDEMNDISDGAIFRGHARLGVASGPIEARTGGRRIKLAIKGYYDEVECANPLGYARGVHTIGCVYVSIINLDVDRRNRLEYTLPVTLVLNSTMKRFGPTLVLGGALYDDNNHRYVAAHSTSFGGQMRELDQGVEFQVPHPSGGFTKVEASGWLVVFCADYLGHAKCLPTAESTGATQPCRRCHWVKEGAQSCSPCSDINSSCKKWPLRTTASMLRHLDAAKNETTKTGRAAALQSNGYYSIEFALHPDVFPHFLPAEGTPQVPQPPEYAAYSSSYLVCSYCGTYSPPWQDVMHDEFSSGTANSELAQLIYMLIAREKVTTLDAVNDAIFDYPSFKDGERPPPIWPSVLKGTTERRPIKGANLRYSGSQTMHFALHSVHILGPLLPDNYQHPAWLSWTAHLRY